MRHAKHVVASNNILIRENKTLRKIVISYIYMAVVTYCIVYCKEAGAHSLWCVVLPIGTCMLSVLYLIYFSQNEKSLGKKVVILQEQNIRFCIRVYMHMKKAFSHGVSESLVWCFNLILKETVVNH